MRKYGEASPANVYTGMQAGVINTYMKRYGKSVSEFTDDEKALLEVDLELAQKEENLLTGFVEPVDEPVVVKTPVKRTAKKKTNVDES